MLALLTPLGAGCSGDRVSTAVAPSPPLARPDVVRFAALGDTGKDDAGQRAVAAALRTVCAREGCDFVALLGDNLYPAGFEADDDPRADRVIREPYAAVAPVYAVLGNHDWAGWDGDVAERQLAWAARQDGVHAPAHAWSFEAWPLLLAGVDTNAVFVRGGGFQASWLAERLAASEAPWKVVVGHHPLRSNGPHGDAGAYEGWRFVPWMSGRAVASFFADGVCGRADLYLGGHDHTRQLLEACGVTLVVAGTGASGTRIVDRGNTPRFADAELGFAWLELRTDGGELRFYGVDAEVDASFALPLP